MDRQVLYLSHGPRYSLFLTRTGATIVVAETQKKGTPAETGPARHFRLSFENANPQTEVAGIEALPGTSNYFSGSNPESLAYSGSTIHQGSLFQPVSRH